MTTTNTKINSAHVGSSFEDYLKESGEFEKIDASARRRVAHYRNIRLAHERALAIHRGGLRSGTYKVGTISTWLSRTKKTNHHALITRITEARRDKVRPR